MLKNNALAEKAFVTPVRSVLFVDDQFPTFEELIRGEARRREADRAGRLVASCRARNYVCDVRNNPDNLAAIEADRVGVSDLVVLDYHLRGEGNSDDAVNFLARLARSPHFNLAIIYTAEENLIATRQKVAARVRGLSPACDAGGELPEVGPDERALSANLDDYLAHRPRIFASLPLLFPQDRATVGALDREGKAALLRRHFDAYIDRTFGQNAENVPATHVPIAMSTSGENGHWVQGGNLFVAIVPKARDDDAAGDNISVLLQKLTAAIVDWSPSLIEVMMAAAAGAVLRHGFRKSEIDFADDQLCSGLVYWFLAGDSAFGDAAQAEADADCRSRIEQLHRVIFDLLCSAALREAADLSEAVIRDKLAGRNPIEIAAEERVQLAKEWAKAKNIDEQKMLLAANAFLCSSAFTGKHVTTGTVFRKDATDEYWLCVSAACEMVPRKPSANNEWRLGLDPFRLVFAARLQAATPATALKSPQHGRSIFVKSGVETIALDFVGKEVIEPSVVPMFAANNAMIADGKFRASIVTKGAQGNLEIQAAEYRPVAQLRPDYASRLLQQTGHHFARIGVDFLKKPEPIVAGAGGA